MDEPVTSETTGTGLIDLDSNNTILTAADFEFGEHLGDGYYAQVFHARKKTGKDKGTIVAMKVVPKNKIFGNEKKISNIKMERSILGALKHPFVNQLYYAFETSHAVFFGLEYMPNGDLFSHLKKSRILDEKTSRVYVAEIILALQYLHKNCIIFRDLKPENILIDEKGHVKLCDFGLAKRLSSRDDQTHTFCGTLDYMAPEIIQNYPYTRAVDWWSVGALLFDVLTGFVSPPFTVPDDRESTMRNIILVHFSFKTALAEVSSEAQDLIYKLLKIKPTERLGAGEADAKELMDHVFFKNINFDDLLAGKFEPLMSKPGPSFKKTLRQRSPFADTSNDKPMILELQNFNYIAPSLLEAKEEPRCNWIMRMLRTFKI